METKPYSNYWFVQLFKLKRALHYSFNFDFLKSTSCVSFVYHPFTEHLQENAVSKIKSLFWTLSYMYDGAFLRKQLTSKNVYYFSKKDHLDVWQGPKYPV